MRKPIKQFAWALKGNWSGEGPHLVEDDCGRPWIFQSRNEAREYREDSETVIKVAIVEVERHGGGR